MGAGVTAASSQEHLRVQAVRKQQDLNSLTRETLPDEISIMEAAYDSEENWEDEVESEDSYCQRKP